MDHWSEKVGYDNECWKNEDDALWKSSYEAKCVTGGNTNRAGVKNEVFGSMVR